MAEELVESCDRGPLPGYRRDHDSEDDQHHGKSRERRPVPFIFLFRRRAARRVAYRLCEEGVLVLRLVVGTEVAFLPRIVVERIDIFCAEMRFEPLRGCRGLLRWGVLRCLCLVCFACVARG